MSGIENEIETLEARFEELLVTDTQSDRSEREPQISKARNTQLETKSDAALVDTR